MLLPTGAVHIDSSLLLHKTLHAAESAADEPAAVPESHGKYASAVVKTAVWSVTSHPNKPYHCRVFSMSRKPCR